MKYLSIMNLLMLSSIFCINAMDLPDLQTRLDDPQLLSESEFETMPTLLPQTEDELETDEENDDEDENEVEIEELDEEDEE